MRELIVKAAWTLLLLATGSCGADVGRQDIEAQVASKEQPLLGLVDRGILYQSWYGKPFLARVFIEPNVKPPDEVEFALWSPGWMTWGKEIVIHESPAVGRGAWTISVHDNKHGDRNGLYAYQLNGAFLEFRMAGFLGFMRTIDEWRTIVSDAPPGSRVNFVWMNDGAYSVFKTETLDNLWSLDYFRVDTVDAGLIDIRLETNAVPANEVEFVLVNNDSTTKNRRITIVESPMAGQGTWTLSTYKGHGIDRNGLYTYQLKGASLIFNDTSVLDISNAIPGARYTFNWRSI